MLRGLGFDPYVAAQVQSILDLNGEIIGELKRSDFFLFIDFRREEVEADQWRGSLFTHQEAAIAYSLGFQKMLFLRQRGVRSEGMLAYIVSNVPCFDRHADVVQSARQAIFQAGWVPAYSRNLIVSNLRWGRQVNYRDHTGEISVQILHGDIENRRPDVGSVGAVARLSAYIANGNRLESPDKSHLKVSGQPGYAQTILPGSHGAFDFLALALGRPHTLTLNSALDVRPRGTLIDEPGDYILEYEVFAPGLPVLAFGVEIRLLPLGIGNVLTAAGARLRGDTGSILYSADSFVFG
jgi:hypothetical protein